MPADVHCKLIQQKIEEFQSDLKPSDNSVYFPESVAPQHHCPVQRALGFATLEDWRKAVPSLKPAQLRSTSFRCLALRDIDVWRNDKWQPNVTTDLAPKVMHPEVRLREIHHNVTTTYDGMPFLILQELALSSKGSRLNGRKTNATQLCPDH